jgi:hypothetical protein
MILDEYREELDLEFRWLNDHPKELLEKQKLIMKLGKKSANINWNEFREKWEKERESGGA